MKSSPDQSTPLGIIAGSGALPLHIAKRTKDTGRDIFIAAIDGVADQEVEQFPHVWIKWGQIDKLFRELKKAGVKELVIIGGVRRPKLENIHFDFGFIRNLPFVLKLTMGGDDSILSNIVKFVEDRGITIVGAFCSFNTDNVFSRHHSCLANIHGPKIKDCFDAFFNINDVFLIWFVFCKDTDWRH